MQVNIQSIKKDILEFTNKFLNQHENSKFYTVEINQEFNLKLHNIAKTCQIKPSNKEHLSIEIFYKENENNIKFVKEDNDFYFELDQNTIITKTICYIPSFYLNKLSIDAHKTSKLEIYNVSINEILTTGNINLLIEHSDINRIKCQGKYINTTLTSSNINYLDLYGDTLKLNISKSSIKNTVYNCDTAIVNCEINLKAFTHTYFNGTSNSGNINLRTINSKAAYKVFKIHIFNGNFNLSSHKHKFHHNGYIQETIRDTTTDINKLFKSLVNITINNGNVIIS